MKDGLQDKDALFRAIGHVVVEFQKTERIFSEVLASHIGLKDEHRRDIIMGASSFGQKVDLYSALRRIDSTKEECNCIDIICAYLRTAEEYRNKIVHSDYYVVTGKKADFIRWVHKKVSIKGGKGLKMSRRLVDIQQIEDCASIMSEMSFTATSGFWLFQNGHDECATILEATKKLRKGLTKRWSEAG